ncbi:MAG TPA: hypothetical protein VIL72_03010 [Beijerinckiaceae bacterium]
MGTAAKAERRDARMRERDSVSAPGADAAKDDRGDTGESPFSEIADEILARLARDHRRAGARVRLSTLHMRQETEPALAAAISELASAGLVRVVDGGTIELTAEGYDLIQRRVLQMRTRLLGRAPGD